MKKYIFILFLHFPIVIFSQNPQENMNKYWNYKYRLYQKFVVSQPAHLNLPGTNLPANGYNPTEIGVYAQKLSFGDASADLGYYIGSLATEYYLLKNKNMSTSQVEEELYRAIYTVYRLDRDAERHYGDDQDRNNGFFIRDDVHEDFAEYWAQRGYTYFNEPYLYGIKSDFTHPDGPEMAEMSQDQIWSLYLGFSLVKKLVDSETPHFFIENEGVDNMLTLSEAVVELVERTRRRMHVKVGGLIGGPFFNEWKIINPVTENTVYRGGSYADLLPHAFLFRRAQEWIADAFPFSFSWAPYDVDDFANVIFIPWPDILDLLPSLHPLLYEVTPKYFNDKGKLILSTISEYGMGSSMENLIHWIYYSGHLYNSNLPSNFDINCQKWFVFDEIPLFHYVLHEKYNMSNDYWFDFYMSYVEQLLNTAPANGPEFYGNFNNPEWISGKRLCKPLGVAYHEYMEGINYFGEKNGIDYMYLHNLYLISYLKIFNWDRYIVDDFPIEYNYGSIFQTVGKLEDQVLFTVNSLKKITAVNKIHSNAKVRYRANEIELGPNFEVELGAIFYAEPNEFTSLQFE